jgi:hypothetical protein
MAPRRRSRLLYKGGSSRVSFSNWYVCGNRSAGSVLVVAADLDFHEIASHTHLNPRDALKDPIEAARAPGGPRRVRALVALRLLEVIRERDLPREILEDEDPSRTMPRRFGLSDVVERQIRTYKEHARKHVRLSDDEIAGLFRFVIRRPDGEEVFHELGRLLVGGERRRRWTHVLPRRAQLAIARSVAKRKLRSVFGRAVGGFGRGPFVIEGRALMFIEADPGGDACHLLSGFCQEVLEQATGRRARVTHTLCQSRGDPLCRWEAEVGEGYTRVAAPVDAGEAAQERS